NAPAPTYQQPMNAPAPVYQEPANTSAPAYQQPVNTPAPTYQQHVNAPAPAYQQPVNNGYTSNANTENVNTRIVDQNYRQPSNFNSGQNVQQRKKGISIKLLIIIISAVLALAAATVIIINYMPSKELYPRAFGNDSTEYNTDSLTITKPDTTILEPVTPPVNELNFSYGTYVGDISNGKANGMGKMTYTKRTLISKFDSKKRYAEAGQYVIGNWYNNSLDHGKLYNKNNIIIETLTIGRAE
ncbi:MAG: hypothetical protein R3Y26_06830, partial [Rikenellaceae bacterium]